MKSISKLLIDIGPLAVFFIFYTNRFMMQVPNAPSPAAPGIVMTHEKIICLLTFHLTARILRADPAPMIVPVIA